MWLALQSGGEAGFEAQKFLLDLREGPGALSATVQAGRSDSSGRGLLDEVVHALTRVLIQARFGKQSGDALKAGFVAFSVAVCGVWRRKRTDQWFVLHVQPSALNKIVCANAHHSLKDDAHL